MEKDIRITDNLSSHQLTSRLEKFRTEMDSLKAENGRVQRYHDVWTKKFTDK